MLNVPTDNIFKFCAIIGLIIIFSSSYYTHNKDIELKLQKNNFNTDNRILNIEINTLTVKVKSLKREVESKLEAEDKIEAEEKFYYLNLVTDYENKESELKKTNEEQLGKANAITIYDNAIKTYYILFFISVIMGILLSIFGFYKWYRIEKNNYIA